MDMFTCPGFSNFVESFNKLEDEIYCQPFNYVGTPEDVTLPRVYFALLKWLDDRGQIDADAYIRAMSVRFKGLPMQQYLGGCIAELNHYRWKQGKERPSWAGAMVVLPEYWLEFCQKHSTMPEFDNAEVQQRRDHLGGAEFFS
jgi:hypothetical protein